MTGFPNASTQAPGKHGNYRARYDLRHVQWALAMVCLCEILNNPPLPSLPAAVADDWPEFAP